MSIKVKSITVNSPRELQVLNEYYLNGDPYFEASPIYTSLEVSVDISGSYTSGVNDFVYSYTGSETFARVPIVGDSATSWEELPAVSINGVLEQPVGSVSAVASVGVDEFIMGLRPMMDMNPTPNPFYVPQKPAGLFLPSSRLIESVAVIGTRTNTSTTVVTDIIENVSCTMPTFKVLGTYPTTARFLLDGFDFVAGGGGRTATIEEDITSWSSAKWRDFRGTYTASETDADGITVDVEMTLS